MIVYVAFEAYYGDDIVPGSKAKAFDSQKKAEEYCSKRNEANKKKNPETTVDCVYWKLKVE